MIQCSARRSNLVRLGDVMGGGIVPLADASAFAGALAAAGSRLVAVDFTATWCGPCQQIGPRFEAMRSEFPFVDFRKVDVDENQEVAQREQIQSMPTFKFYRHGAVVASFSGADEGKLRMLLSAHGSEPPTDIPPGAEVVLRGIKSRSEVNGRRGVARSFDASKGRYAVEIPGADGAEPETIALRRENLVQRLRVALVRDDADAALPAELPASATEGTVCGYDDETQLYTLSVLTDAGDAAKFEVAPACIRVPDGSTGVLLGLVGAAEHNGKPARVLGLDGPSGRYDVAVDATKRLRLKRSNLRV